MHRRNNHEVEREPAKEQGRKNTHLQTPCIGTLGGSSSARFMDKQPADLMTTNWHLESFRAQNVHISEWWMQKPSLQCTKVAAHHTANRSTARQPSTSSQ